MVIVPEQKREFELSLESKARGVAVSIRGVAAGAAVSEDYSAVVDQAMQVLSGDQAIDYVVMTKNDGFSIVIDRSTWKTEKLGEPGARGTKAGQLHRHLAAVRTPRLSVRLSVRLQRHPVGLDSHRPVAGCLRRERAAHLQKHGRADLLCGALSLLISLVYAARLVRPIRILHAAVEKVAHGDLHARAEVHSHDEIERLAEAFNEMARTILGRNQILESVSFAAKQFLSDGNRDTIVGEVLEKVGQAAGASRACVLKI